MITKRFRITIALLALVAMGSLPISAGQVARKAEQSLPLQKVVFLQVADLYTYQDLNTYLKVVNSTHSTIPRGTLLYWELRRSSAKEEGSKRLTRYLTPGEFESFSVAYATFGLPVGKGPITAKVWYIPDTGEKEQKPPLPTQQNPPTAPAPPNAPNVRTELQIRAVITQGGGPLLSAAKARLFFTNSTRSNIDVGKTIYWSLNDANKGSFRLDRGLSPGEGVQQMVGWNGNEKTSRSVDPKAWYFKNETAVRVKK